PLSGDAVFSNQVYRAVSVEVAGERGEEGTVGPEEIADVLPVDQVATCTVEDDAERVRNTDLTHSLSDGDIDPAVAVEICRRQRRPDVARAIDLRRLERAIAVPAEHLQPLRAFYRDHIDPPISVDVSCERTPRNSEDRNLCAGAEGAISVAGFEKQIVRCGHDDIEVAVSVEVRDGKRSVPVTEERLRARGLQCPVSVREQDRQRAVGSDGDHV